MMTPGTKINVLDHGYVQFIEAMGTGLAGVGEVEQGMEFGTLVKTESDYEVGIIEAARQSTQGSFRGWNVDDRLLKRLSDHNHTTPFEFSELTVEVQAPIAVLREWLRSRTQSYNEMSARYAQLPALYYVPDLEVLKARGKAAATETNKQAAGTAPYSEQDMNGWLSRLESFYKEAEAIYQRALDIGVPKELARLSMPVGHYSRMRAKANLHNWFHFLDLRTASNAQWEIRQFALAVGTIIEAVFPRSYALWSHREIM